MKLKFLFAIMLILANISCSKTENEFEKEPENPATPETPGTPETPEEPSEGEKKRSPEATRLLDYLKNTLRSLR